VRSSRSCSTATPPTSEASSSDVHLPDQLADNLAALRQSERLADDARQAAAHAQRRAAEQLRAAGMSVRDVGRLLGVSHERVSQILARESA
jgi:transcriptional regulator with XRE-family HTH domain